MTRTNIIFVHGTGVRLPAYRDNVDTARAHALGAGIDAHFVECPWGDQYGSEFIFQSLPNLSEEHIRKQQSEDFVRWSCLYYDPMSELEKLTIRDETATTSASDGEPAWERKWKAVCAYQPSPEMAVLLQRAGVKDDLWDEALYEVTENNTVARLAFKHSAHELPEAVQALARALVAQLHRMLGASGISGPGGATRDAMVQRLIVDWGGAVLGPGAFFGKMLKRISTSVLKEYRIGLSAAIAPFIGDILLYQSRGERIRQYIRDAIASVEGGQVVVVAHSLGGIACVDLLASPGAPRIDRLVTVGSQAPLLYELGALASLRPGDALPPGFPHWLNVYDLNDMLSYVAEPLFAKEVDPDVSVRDLAVDSGQPFPDAHSAYFSNDAVWRAIGDFIAAP